jgi:transcriptional regulator with XRE-family HTH domain
MDLRIKEFRLSRGLTVEQLAEKVGMSKSYVSEIENGKKQANGRRLEAFALALGVRPADLIEDDGLIAEFKAHMDVVAQLSPADREAVERHARSLLAARNQK